MRPEKGNLYLIPCTLGDTPPLEVLPLLVKKTVENTNHFIVGCGQQIAVAGSRCSYIIAFALEHGGDIEDGTQVIREADRSVATARLPIREEELLSSRVAASGPLSLRASTVRLTPWAAG